MKFSLVTILLAPAVMGRACKPRPQTTSALATSVSSVAIAPISTSVSEGNTSYDETAPKASVVSSKVSTSVPATTLATSSKAAASTAAAAQETTSDDSTTETDSSSSSSAISGTSTFYGGNLSGGNCMFTDYTLPSGIYGTAFSGAKWDNAAECGACIQVTGPTGKTIKAMIVDQCPECAEGHLDLFPDAFTAVGGTEGTVSTSYTFVPCGITSPLVLHNKSGTSAYWFSMQVVNHNKPVESLEVSTDGGSTWQATTRQDYNFFENSSGFGVETMKIRVTSTSGEQVVVSNVGVTADAEYTATSNF